MRIAIGNAIYATPTHPRIVGGAEVFARQLAEKLVEGGDEVSVIRFSPTGSHEVEVVNGVTVHFVPVRNFFPPFETRRNPLLRTAWHFVDDWRRADGHVASILADFKPDVFHTNTLNGLTTDVWNVARGLKIPILHTLHDYYLSCPRCSRFKQGHSCEKTCGSCSLLTHFRRKRDGLVDGVVAVSQRTLDLHTSNDIFTGTRLKRVIHNVPNPDIVFTPQPARSAVLTIGYLGRFSEEKGVRLLAQAAGMVPEGAVRLKLAGNVAEDERARLQSLAPRVEMDFVGFVKPSEFYATVDLVTIPSIWEDPNPLALTDALAAGRPVLATHYGGVPEMIDDGLTGWIAPADPAGFAAVIARIVAEPELIEAGHRALSARQTRRTLSDIVADYRALYQTLAKR